ncbi:pre-RNA processing PIH1/Nop17-domain-containing protein, partial [Haematococcus lacustris]
MDANEASAEELLALVEEIQRQTGSLDDVPPDLAQLLRRVKKEQGKPVEDIPSEEIIPRPGFVVKTSDASGAKVFINMCGHDKVAAPGNWQGLQVPEEVQAALDNVDSLTDAQQESLRFPLSMTPPQPDVDKKGAACTTFDCCLNEDVIKTAALHRGLKLFIIELAINWIAHKHKMQLDPKFKLPKMRYKGGDKVLPQRIRLDRKRLVTEVADVPEPPVFPLLTKKVAPGKLESLSNGGARTAATSTPRSAPATEAAAAAAPAENGAGNLNGSVVPDKTASKPGIADKAAAPSPRLLGSPEFHGRPVQTISLLVELPAVLCASHLTDRDWPMGSAGPGKAEHQQGSGQAGAGPGASCLARAVRVEVCAERVLVGAPGCAELVVQLPVAVDDQGAEVRLDVSSRPLPTLLLRLKPLLLDQLIARAQAQVPHSFGQLGLKTSMALELEP